MRIAELALDATKLSTWVQMWSRDRCGCELRLARERNVIAGEEPPGRRAERRRVQRVGRRGLDLTRERTSSRLDGHATRAERSDTGSGDVTREGSD